MRAARSTLKGLFLERLLPHAFLDAPARDEDVLAVLRGLLPQPPAAPAPAHRRPR